MSIEDTGETESPDDIATITPQTYRSQVIRKAIQEQAGKFVVAGDYVAATLGAQFRGSPLNLEGAAVVTIRAFSKDGILAGEATVTIPISFPLEYQRSE